MYKKLAEDQRVTRNFAQRDSKQETAKDAESAKCMPDKAFYQYSACHLDLRSIFYDSQISNDSSDSPLRSWRFKQMQICPTFGLRCNK
jgi:hypothetical protein